MFTDKLSLENLSFPSEKIAITWHSGEGVWKDITYGEFRTQVDKMSALLREKGIGRKNSVIFLGENHPFWLQAFFAHIKNSSVVIPVDGSVTDERLLDIVALSGASGIFASPLQQARLEKIWNRFPEKFAIFRNELEPWLEKNGKAVEPASVPDGTAAIFFTSGTTGQPKGIVLSEKALAASIVIGTGLGNIGSSDIMLTLLPFTHVYGMVDAGFVPLATGARNILMSSFNPMEVFQVISKFRVNFLNVVPRLAEVILAVLTQSDSKLAGLNLFVGGASCKPDVIRMLRKRGIKTSFGFGMTETAGGILANEGEPAESVGIPPEDIEIKIDNQSDGFGEILIKSPTMLTCVLNNEEETKKIFHNGFLKTGDLGMIDSNGYVHIKGRLKDVIVCGGGMNVYPDELEARLELSPFVEEYSVTVMKEDGYEFPMLVVKPRAAFFKDRPTLDIQEYISEQVKKQISRWAEWERFRKIMISEKPLPRSFNQKVQRHVLSAMFSRDNEEIALSENKQKTASDNSSLNKYFEKTVKFLAHFLSKKHEQAFLKASLNDFPQLDSLGKIALLAAFENRFKIRIPGIQIENESSIENTAFLLSKYLENNAGTSAVETDKDVNFLPPERDNSKDAVSARLDFLKDLSGDELEEFSPPVAASHLTGNIEGFIGYAQIPTGIAGPLLVNGDHAKGEFYLPLSTTEGALVSSVSRGAKLLTSAGGVNVKIISDGVIRSPIFMFNSLGDMIKFKEWFENSLDKIKSVAASTTRHGRLKEVEMLPLGTSLAIRMVYYSGDASGQNMCTIATQKVLDYVAAEYKGPMTDLFLECNISGDKKINAFNFIRGRGKKVIAEARIPGIHIEDILHTTPERMVKNWEMSVLGSFQAHSFGIQAHYSNLLTALYLATGQDAACSAESSAGITHLSLSGSDLKASVTVPGIMVATVGGGTRLATQQACLRILGCTGEGKAGKLAEITAAGILAAELSLIGAMAAGDFSSAHAKYGRK
ncbi:MAG: AMP-binding protein [Candidatus Riflebacteria bacterium]|nr:AMP-binding protein [Candidatus Riflebacteria bacterium]